MDKLGRTTKTIAKYIPGGDRTLDYAFDARGDLLTFTLTEPSGVLVHAYTYATDSGRIATATLPGSATPISITRWPHDGEKLVTYPGGVTREVDYDVRGPVSEIRIKPPSGTPLVEKWTYAYTDVLNVQTMTDASSRVTAYGYDALDRLTSADHPILPAPQNTLPDLETFTYDGVGNRTMSGYAHDANHRMRASPGRTVDYDDDGNTRVRDPGLAGQATYTWDQDNRLTAYASGATSASYRQDPFARRFKKTVGSTTTWYLWAGDHLLAEYGGTGTRSARYTQLDGFAPAQMAVPNGGSELIYSLHADRLNTPRVMTSYAGSLVWQAAYEAYGKAHLSTALSTPLNVRLPGQYFDAETESHYNRFRYFDGSTGRYVSADPIGQAGGVNAYRFARSNPLFWLDPFGLSELVFDRSEGSLTVYPGDGEGGRAEGPPQEFPASNNVSRANQATDPYLPEGNGPAPNGTFRTEPMLPAQGWPDSALGDSGFVPIDLRPLDENGNPQNRVEGGGTVGPGRGGVGIHAGRVGVCDGARRCGSDHATQGCVRTTPEAMGSLASDPPTRITIQD